MAVKANRTNRNCIEIQIRGGPAFGQGADHGSVFPVELCRIRTEQAVVPAFRGACRHEFRRFYFNGGVPFCAEAFTLVVEFDFREAGEFRA